MPTQAEIDAALQAALGTTTPPVVVDPADGTTPSVKPPKQPKAKTGSSGKAKGKQGSKKSKKSEATQRPIRQRFVAYWKGFGEADGFKGKLAHAGGGLLILIGVILAIWFGGYLLIKIGEGLIGLFRRFWVSIGWHGFMSSSVDTFYRLVIIVAVVGYLWYFIGRGRKQRAADREAKATWRAKRNLAVKEKKQLEKQQLAVPETVKEKADSKEPTTEPHRGWIYGVLATLLIGTFFWAMPFHYAESICAAHGYTYGSEKDDRGCYSLLVTTYTDTKSIEDRAAQYGDMAYVGAENDQLYGSAPSTK